MPDKTIVITGASDGIGREAARALHALGHRVILVGRSPEKTAAAAAELGGAPHYTADFASLDQVKELALRLRAELPRVDVLCNNAGGLFSPRRKTPDGFERTFQINHLAPLLLTLLLRETLSRSRASVLFTASGAHRIISLYRPSDPQWAPLPLFAYGNSKLMNILTAMELHLRWQARGLSAASYHPGVVASNFAAEARSPVRLMYSQALKKALRMVSSQEGADTLVWLADGQPGQDWTSGGYYIRRAPAPTSRQGSDPALARRLWEDSLHLLSPWLDGPIDD